MSNEDRIRIILKEDGLEPVGAIVANPSVSNGYFVSLRLEQQRGGRKLPSGRTLAVAKERLAQAGFLIDFLLIDEAARHVEESLRASLIASFPSDVRNVFYSARGSAPEVWIEFKRPLSEGVRQRLAAHLQKFSEIFALTPLKLIHLGEIDTATKMDMLTTLRLLAPAEASALTDALRAQDLNVPSVDWASRRLDALRKANLVLRREDGAYVLTREALASLGTRKTRRSPDVRRLLALARRVR